MSIIERVIEELKENKQKRLSKEKHFSESPLPVG